MRDVGELPDAEIIFYRFELYCKIGRLLRRQRDLIDAGQEGTGAFTECIIEHDECVNAIAVVGQLIRTRNIDTTLLNAMIKEVEEERLHNLSLRGPRLSGVLSVIEGATAMHAAPEYQVELPEVEAA